MPQVEDSTSYGTQALKVRGKLMLRLKEDGQTLVCRVTWPERERLLNTYPKVFFLTDHYREHPWVLMNMSSASLAVLRPAVFHAWEQVAPKTLVAKSASHNTNAA